MSQKIFICALIFLFSFQDGQSQKVKPKAVDSTKVLYQKIERNSSKSKFKKLMYKLIFTSTRKRKPTNNDFRDKIDAEIGNNAGKIIRNINIETLDPFGYSVEDDKEKPSNSFERFGNDIHLKSKKWTIRNQLLFKKNQPLDSLLIKESERLVRSQRFVRSVIIKTVPVENSADSIDVSIRVLDSWSLIPNGSISDSRVNLEVTERNFLGLGHEFENDFGREFSPGRNSYNGQYSFNNIKNSFINATLVYNNSFINDIRKSARVERIFYSPLTRFAGGVFYESRKFTDSLPTVLPEFEALIFENETKSAWFGHASKLFSAKTVDSRNTSFVTTIGYKNLNYSRKASLTLDPYQFLNDEEIYLVSFGISTRKFIQDKFIFNYDIIEDIPFGKVFAITAGFQNKNSVKRNYYGGRFSYGHYYNFGYLSTNIELGSFFHDNKSEETTIKIEANYFTNLLSIGNWKLRHFIKPSLVIGINRNNSIKDRVSLTGMNGFGGFDNPLFNGSRKLALMFQTQTYVPGAWKGFHFSPFINTAIGLVGDSEDTFLNNKLYSTFTLGVLISNDYLVFNRFQVSFSFYPTIPLQGTNVFKTNTVKNDDFNIPEYSIGEPAIIEFK
ncbi:hypothetical protein [Flavobacterium sp.]